MVRQSNKSLNGLIVYNQLFIKEMGSGGMVEFI
jgi:hypothetical protein